MITYGRSNFSTSRSALLDILQLTIHLLKDGMHRYVVEYLEWAWSFISMLRGSDGKSGERFVVFTLGDKIFTFGSLPRFLSWPVFQVVTSYDSCANKPM